MRTAKHAEHAKGGGVLRAGTLRPIGRLTKHSPTAIWPRRYPFASIVIDVSAAHFWDISAVGALDRVVLKGRGNQRRMEVVGLNAASSSMVERFASHPQGSAAAVAAAD
jgi:MFS superfamily sulfate permease-like transporter